MIADAESREIRFFGRPVTDTRVDDRGNLWVAEYPPPDDGVDRVRRYRLEPSR